MNLFRMNVCTPWSAKDHQTSNARLSGYEPVEELLLGAAQGDRHNVQNVLLEYLREHQNLRRTVEGRLVYES